MKDIHEVYYFILTLGAVPFIDDAYALIMNFFYPSSVKLGLLLDW